MKKHLLITLLLALFASATTWAQSDPKAKAPKSKTEQAAKAEEKSDGAAFSGQGKGGEKDMVEKEKGQHKGKHAKKGKKGHPHKGHKEDKEKGKDLKRVGEAPQPQGRPKPTTEPAPKPTQPAPPAEPVKPSKPTKESPTDAKPKTEPVKKSGGK
ncbi:MAG: hypothetical protein IT259_20390 [Saprospiraceae bacterium]|nr:hypothetical protein [Saprospiraceae bacterium]